MTIEPSVGRLLSGVSAHTSIPIFATSGSGVSTIPPGGVLGDTDYRDTGNDSDSDDDDHKDDAPKPSANDLKWNHIYVHERDRMAPGAVRMVRAHYQSFQGRATVIRCRDIRNKHEVDTLSGIADAIIAGQGEVALEMVIRRMVGVEDADAGGGRDWDTATLLDLTKPGSLYSDDLRRRIRRDTAQIKANRKKEARTTAGTGGNWKKKGGGRGLGGGSGARRGGDAGNTTTRA
jgi:hypothetical protein